MTDRWAMFVDVALCSNCRNCYLACKDEYVGNSFPGYSDPQPLHGHHWIDIRVKERGQAPVVDVANLPVTCMQCEDAPCMAAGADGAVYRREDGIVMIDPDKARGRKDLVESCPYGAIYWNEEHSVPQKWSFDAHLLDGGWAEPRASQVCPTGALAVRAVSDEALESEVKAGGYQVLNPELGTRPRVFYKNLHRYEKCFVSLTVLCQRGGVRDVVVGAAVSVRLASGVELATETDDFGEAKIDGIDPGSAYEIRVDGRDLGKWTQAGVLAESVWLGEVVLAAV